MITKYVGPWYIVYCDNNSDPARYHRDELYDPEMGPIIYKLANGKWSIDQYLWMQLPSFKRPNSEYATVEETIITMDKILIDLDIYYSTRNDMISCYH